MIIPQARCIDWQHVLAFYSLMGVSKQIMDTMSSMLKMYFLLPYGSFEIEPDYNPENKVLTITFYSLMGVSRRHREISKTFARCIFSFLLPYGSFGIRSNGTFYEDYTVTFYSLMGVSISVSLP